MIKITDIPEVRPADQHNFVMVDQTQYEFFVTDTDNKRISLGFNGYWYPISIIRRKETIIENAAPIQELFIPKWYMRKHCGYKGTGL